MQESITLTLLNTATACSICHKCRIKWYMAKVRCSIALIMVSTDSMSQVLTWCHTSTQHRTTTHKISTHIHYSPSCIYYLPLHNHLQ